MSFSIGRFVVYLVFVWGCLAFGMEMCRLVAMSSAADGNPLAGLICFAVFGSIGIAVVGWCFFKCGAFLSDESRMGCTAMGLVMMIIIACGIPYGIYSMQRAAAKDYLDPRRMTSLECPNAIINPADIHFVRFGKSWGNWSVDKALWRQKAVTKRVTKTNSQDQEVITKNVLCLRELLHRCDNVSIWITCETQWPDHDTLHDVCDAAAVEQCGHNLMPYEVTMRTYNNRDMWFSQGLNDWADVRALVTPRPGKGPVIVLEYASPGPDMFVHALAAVEETIMIILVVSYVVLGVFSLVGAVLFYQ